MASESVISRILKIHESELELGMALSGGGSVWLGQLAATPGASRTLLDAKIPYSTRALCRFLGARPESYCSGETALLMAVRAYLSAREFSAKKAKCFGIGLTAALATNRPKKGSHRFFMAVQGEKTSRLVSIGLEKNARTRLEEEELIVEIGTNEVLKLVDQHEELSQLSQGDNYSIEDVHAVSEWCELFHAARPFVHSRSVDAKPPSRFGLLAGSFNPLHDGHRQMAAIGQRRMGCPVHFELAIRNADKPPLDYLTIQNRISQFDTDLWLSNLPTFCEKSRAFPGAVFLVGVDTLHRIAQPEYYRETGGLDASIETIHQNGCRFLVFGRRSDGEFINLNSIDIPNRLRELCDSVPENEFRNDISSTELRQIKL